MTAAIELGSAGNAGPRPRDCKHPAELEAWKREAIAGLGEPGAASAVEARQDRRATCAWPDEQR
jgi:hypothetical protein